MNSPTNSSWTTVAEEERLQNEHVSEQSPPRKLSFALGGAGVALMLIGASPFLFDGQENAGQYSAFFTQEQLPSSPAADTTAAVPAQKEQEGRAGFFGLPALSQEEVEIPAEDEVETVAAEEAEQVEQDFVAEATPIVLDDLDTTPLLEVPSKEVVAEETENPFFGIPTQKEEQEQLADEQPALHGAAPEQVAAEGYRVNTHTGTSADAIHFGEEEFFDDFVEVSAEDIFEEESSDLHAAAPRSPQTGTPLLPLLLASGGIAALWRRFRQS